MTDRKSMSVNQNFPPCTNHMREMTQREGGFIPAVLLLFSSLDYLFFCIYLYYGLVILLCRIWRILRPPQSVYSSHEIGTTASLKLVTVVEIPAALPMRACFFICSPEGRSNPNSFHLTFPTRMTLNLHRSDNGWRHMHFLSVSDNQKCWNWGETVGSSQACRTTGLQT